MYFPVISSLWRDLISNKGWPNIETQGQNKGLIIKRSCLTEVFGASLLAYELEFDQVTCNYWFFFHTKYTKTCSVFSVFTHYIGIELELLQPLFQLVIINNWKIAVFISSMKPATQFSRHGFHNTPFINAYKCKIQFMLSWGSASSLLFIWKILMASKHIYSYLWDICRYSLLNILKQQFIRELYLE